MKMKCVLLITIIIFLRIKFVDAADVAENDGPLTCAGGQVWNNCASKCPRTCQDRLGIGAAGKCLHGCQQRCECVEPTPYERDGQCISEAQCPGGKAQILKGFQPCRSGKVWTQCGQDCPRTCSDLLGLGNGECKQGPVAKCQCPPETPIEHDGMCITPEQCPNGKPSSLPYNPCAVRGAVRVTCGQRGIRTCDDGLGLEGGMATVGCVTTCQCPLETPIQLNKECVTHDKCPGGKAKIINEANFEHYLAQGRVFSNCARACEKTCYDSTGTRFGNCPLQCRVGWTCPYYRPIELENGTCATEDACPGGSAYPGQSMCRGGQEWTGCAADCHRTCEDPHGVGIGGKECQQGCQQKCECPAEKPIWHENQCIKLNQCPGGEQLMTSGYNPCVAEGQVWNPCAQSCARTCDDPVGYRGGLCPLGAFAQCECPPHMPILHEDRCVTLSDCPNLNSTDSSEITSEENNLDQESHEDTTLGKDNSEGKVLEDNSDENDVENNYSKDKSSEEQSIKELLALLGSM